MCILCVASRWSRRIVTMLPWLVIPLIVLWAFSQLLPPAFRFEVTSPRLACLFVIFIGLGWYEILMPRLSVWRARRVALMRERKRIKALEAAKWRKEATRRCRNCLTAYRDQNPGGGRFMCTYCGHISRRPVLDISNVVPEGVGSVVTGAGSELGGKNIRLWDGKGGPSDWSANSSWLGGSFSGLANCWRDRNSLLILRVLFSFLSCIRWVWRRLCRGASCGGVGVSSTSRKVGLKKGEEGLGSQENRGEKARRKAEEKRQARLEKEMLEEEERKQREEVARLVEERRRLRDEKVEAEKVSEREAVAEKERESRRDKETERRRQEKMKEREKGLGKDKSHTDAEEVKKRNSKESERKYELDKKGDKNSTEVGKVVENSRVQVETGHRSSDIAAKGGINGSVKVSGSRHFDSVKGSPNTPPKSPTHMSDGSSFWGKSLRAASNFGIKSGKPGSSVDKTQTSVGESPIVSTSLQSKQNTRSAWNRMGWAWGKGNGIASKDASRQLPSAGDSTGNMHGGGFGGKLNINGVDKNPGIILSRPPVGVELKSASTGSTMSKPWHQLFSNSSDSSSESCSTDVGDQGDEQSQAGTGTTSSSLVATSMGSSPFNIYFGSSPAVSLGLADATSVFSNSVLVSVSAAEPMNLSGSFSSPSVVPVVSSVSDETADDLSYVPDPVSLLGPVSESLDSFSLNPGARHSSDIGRSILSSDRVPIPGPINRPGPIEAPMSKLLPSGIVDDVHCTGDQLPSITEPWGLPSLSFDRTNCASEQGKWQMWETPQLGQSEIGPLLSSDWEKDLMRPLPEKAVQSPFKSENHIPSVFSQQTTLGIPNPGVDPVSSSNNLWLNIPAFGSAVNSWEGHDRHQSPPICANGITQESTGLTYDSSILANGHSYEQSANSFWSNAITAAAVALALSEVPISRTVAGVRIGLIGDQFVINPTVQQMEMSKLDLLLAGTAEAILMIEGYSDFLSEEILLEAVEVGQGAVRDICKAIDGLVCKSGKVKMTDMIRLPPPDLYEHVEDLSGGGLIEALEVKSKIPRMKAISALEKEVMFVLSGDEYRREHVIMNGFKTEDATLNPNETVPGTEEYEEDEEVVDGEVDEGDVHIKPVLRKPITKLFDPVDVKLAFKEVTSKIMRKRIVQEGRRSDGRHATEIRKIQSQCGLLPRAHGSALFTRGETQSLAVATLGGNSMGQRLDNLTEADELKRFYLQYSFPPSAVGEVGRIGGPSRREIGHGMLAERALEPALPAEDDFNFPYVIRVESTITESNGSSSMASVCGGCLALLDAGVPLKCSIAGIAMGMVFDTKDCGGDGAPLILSDIIGSEDALGDMDFKVAGNETGITAFQMDLKMVGITVPIMKQALAQARKGICHILAEMSKCSPAPSRRLSMYAPVIHCLKIQPEKLNIVIGSGGKTVKNIIEETGVDYIDTEPNGLVKIIAKEMESLEKAITKINGLIMVPTVGDVFRNCEVKSIAPYGVFVEIAPGREGLLHISELSTKFVAKAEDIVKVGDRLDVKLIEKNERGQLRLSRRALIQNEDQEKSSSKELTTRIKEKSNKEFASAVKEKISKELASPVKQKLTSKELAITTKEGSTQMNGQTK